MIASSSAITTRTGFVTSSEPSLRSSGVQTRGGELVGHAVEQRVLFAFEIDDRPAQRVALHGLGDGMTMHFMRLCLGERRLRHERPQARILRLGREERALFLGD